MIGVGKVQCIYQFSVNAFSISDKAIEGNKQLIFLLYYVHFRYFFIHIFSEINNISIQKAMFRTVFLNNNVSYLQFPCARLKFSFSFKGVSPKLYLKNDCTAM